MTTYIDVTQRSEAWIEERLGSVGASEIYDAVAKQKSGKYYAKREDLLYKKLAEKITGPSTNYVSPAMRHGIETEGAARTAYELHTGFNVSEVGIFKHNRISGTHASPDGIIAGTSIGLELKCPNSSTHLRTLLTGEVQENYVYQCQWQMACAGLDAVDFASFDPRFPVSAQLYIQRITRDSALIEEIEREIEIFLAELAQLESKFNSQFK